MVDEDFNLGDVSEDDLDIPNNPGPAIAGRTPVVGSLRRSNGVMVLRDELKDL